MIPKPKRCRKLVILRLERPDNIGKDVGSNYSLELVVAG